MSTLSRLDRLIPLGERLAGGGEGTEATQDAFYAISTGRRAMPTGDCSHSFVRRALQTATLCVVSASVLGSRSVRHSCWESPCWTPVMMMVDGPADGHGVAWQWPGSGRCLLRPDPNRSRDG